MYIYIYSMCIYLDHARIFQNWILFQHVFSASKSRSLRSRKSPAHGAPPIVAPTCGKPIENHRFARIYDEMMGLTRLNLIHIYIYTWIHIYIYIYIYMFISDPKHQPIAEGSISRTTKTWNVMKFQPHCSKWPPSALLKALPYLQTLHPMSAESKWPFIKICKKCPSEWLDLEILAQGFRVFQRLVVGP